MTTEAKSEVSTNEGVLAAINEALGSSGDEHDVTTDDATAEGAGGLGEEEGDTPADEGTENSDSSDESGGDEAGGDKPEGEGVEPAASADKQPTYAELVKDAAKLGIRERDANGRIKSAETLAAEIAAKQQVSGKSGTVPAKEPDPLTDPIDKSLKTETQQRIRTLIDRTKEATERATVAQGNYDTLVGGLQAANVSPEQFGETISFLALFNSQDPKQQAQALELLEDMADKLSTFLGAERRSSDPIAKHADLQTEVQQGKLSATRAREIARARNQQGFRQELTTSVQTANQQQAEQQRALDTARNDLNTLEQSLKASDPLYARKKAAILPALKAAFKHIPPAQWKATFEQAYKDARVSAPAKQTTPTAQPMRAGKAPAGSGASAQNGGNTGLTGGPAKSMFEAIWGHAPK